MARVIRPIKPPLKSTRGRPRGSRGLMVFVSKPVEAWLRREAKRTGVPAANIMELALLRLMHSRPEGGLQELREEKAPGATVKQEAVTIPADNPAVRAVFGRVE